MDVLKDMKRNRYIRAQVRKDNRGIILNVLTI